MGAVNHNLMSLSPSEGMKPKSSAGLYEISSKLLKHCSRGLLSPSNYYRSLAQGIFPTALKTAKYTLNIKAVVKDINNFRPIPLIPTFSKVIERVVLKRLIDYCKEHTLLSDKQHGLIKERSTTTAIIALNNYHRQPRVRQICLQYSPGPS